MLKKNREKFINFRFTKKLVDHDIYPGHFHTNERIAQHIYAECIDKNKDNDSGIKKCEEEKKKAFEKASDDRVEFAKEYKKRGVHFCIKNNLKAKQELECVSNCDISTNGLGESSFLGTSGLKVSSTDAILSNKACKKLKEKCDKKYENLYSCNDEINENECKKNPIYLDQYYNCKGGIKSDGIDLNIKNHFIGNVLRKSTEGNPFQIIYYLFTFFAFILFGGIAIWIIWWLIVLINKITGNTFANHFPARIIWQPLSLYFDWPHRFLIQFAGFCFVFLLGIVVLLYFFKKAFGWWPAEWVWDSIGIFKGSKPAFRWFDSFFGCLGTNGPLFCNSQAMWNLIEDWIIVTCKKNIKNCGNKSENEIRDAINAFKSIADRDSSINIKTIEDSENNAKKNISNVDKKISNTRKIFEKFENNKNKKKLKSKKLIEEFFSFAEKLDEIDSSSDTVSNSNDLRDEGIESNKEKYDEEGDQGEEGKKTYDEAEKKKEEDEDYQDDDEEDEEDE